ncbi:unnamed protein product [Moneuplotes crassus]|uniref:BZIP domain-containing protein n=1 Tax=Euplotes crassus TaxID=5936 RepID=A0AAD2CZY7_EUPCR|nr:unnamed protein product [Moneuplotes crassus]
MSEVSFNTKFFTQTLKEEPLDETKRKTVNKLRSQEYRKRRKQYIQSLEHKNKLLSEENVLLKQEIHILRSKISHTSEFSSAEADSKTKVDISENFAFYQLSTMVKKDPNSVRFSQLAMAASDTSNWNPNRIQVIKDAFNDVINYIISKDSKCYVSAFKSMKPSEYLKKVNSKRSFKARYKELVDMSPREVLLNQKLSEPITTYFTKYGTEFFKNLKDCGKLVKKLITIRNEIISNSLKREQILINTNLIQHFTKDDYITMCELVGKLDGSKYLKPHYLWDIPSRDKNSEDYLSYCLSE